MDALMTDFEEKLLASSFSQKDIRKLKSIVQKDKYQEETLQQLVNALSKRFLGSRSRGFCPVILP